LNEDASIFLDETAAIQNLGDTVYYFLFLLVWSILPFAFCRHYRNEAVRLFSTRIVYNYEGCRKLKQDNFAVLSPTVNFVMQEQVFCIIA